MLLLDLESTSICQSMLKMTLTRDKTSEYLKKLAALCSQACLDLLLPLHAILSLSGCRLIKDQAFQTLSEETIPVFSTHFKGLLLTKELPSFTQVLGQQ